MVVHQARVVLADRRRDLAQARVVHGGEGVVARLKVEEEPWQADEGPSGLSPPPGSAQLEVRPVVGVGVYGVAV